MAIRWTILLLCLIVLVTGLSAMVAVPVRAETIIPGNYTVTTTETWDLEGSPYIVQGSLSIASTGHLILEPGVEVQIESGHVFDVQDGGTLTAEGTEPKPITITAISGYFIGLRLWSGAHASLAYCDVSNAGDSAWPSIDIQATDVVLDHCTIHDSGVGSSAAVQVIGAGLSPALTHTTIENNTGYAIYQSTIDMTPTYLDLTLTGNGTDAVVWNNGTLNSALTLDGAQLNGSPFIALDSVNVESGGHLTLTADTELLMSAARGLWVHSSGVLAAEGTQTDAVAISARDPASPFVGIVFLPGSSGSLAHCNIDHAGASAYPAVDVQSSDVTLDHCTLHDNVAHGVELMGAGLSPTILNTAIQNNTGYAIYQSTIDMTPIYQGLTISDNGTDAVVWSSGYLNRGLTLDGQEIDGAPFISLNTINVNAGGHLVLNPGTELQMQGGKGLWVQSDGTLTAQGTAADPTVLTARDPGAPFVKLCFLPGSMGNLTHFDLSHAGASASPALEIQSSDVHLDQCTIHDNVAGSGAAVILSGAGLSPTIADTTIQDNDGRALHQTTIDMTPVYTNLIFSGNDTDAVVFGAGDLYRAVTLDGTQLNGSPFISLDQINIWNGAHLTLNPGTELRMAASKAIYVESGGALTAEGTGGQPVTVTSVEPGSPFYKVHFLPGSISSLAYCDVSRAGASGFDALAIYTPEVSLSHCIIHDNEARGVRLFQGAGSFVLDNMVLMDNASDGLLVDPGVEAVLRHTTIARHAGDGVRVVDGGTAVFNNTIVAGNETGVRVEDGGVVTMVHTLWDDNTTDVIGTVDEWGHLTGPAAFGADGYHLTASSSALQQGVDAGVLDDIDGEARPQPADTAPDVGADECPEERPEQMGDIYMRDNALDDGSVPSSSPWWVSPDIWVRNDGDCTQTDHQKPIGGTTATVCVRVHNRSETAVEDITVDVYWTNAALWLSWPASWSTLGSFDIPLLAGGATTVQSVPWSVPYFEGHFCLLTRADAPKDPIGSGTDTVIPVNAVRNNNNIAHKNTNIVSYPEITACGLYTTTVATDLVHFDAVNAWNITATVDIEFDSSDFPIGIGGSGLIVEPGIPVADCSTLTNFYQVGSQLIPQAFPAILGGCEMAPGEVSTFVMSVTAEIDERFTLQITELETASGTDLGGIEYVRDLPRCLYLPIMLKRSPP